jgi:integrase
VTVNESPKLADAELAPMASEVKTKHNAMTRRFIRSLGLPDIRLHDVRHSYVVAARLAGLPMEIISRRIGHADVGVTMRIYNHILEYELRDGAMTVAAFIRSS